MNGNVYPKTAAQTQLSRSEFQTLLILILLLSILIISKFTSNLHPLTLFTHVIPSSMHFLIFKLVRFTTLKLHTMTLNSLLILQSMTSTLQLLLQFQTEDSSPFISPFKEFKGSQHKI